MNPDLYKKPHSAVFRRGDIDAPNKLAIGVCTLGLVRIETMMTYVLSGMPLGQAQAFIPVVGYGIQDARNIAWNIAEGQGWEYFLFWDDDIIAPGGSVETLLETMEQNPEIDILGGVYPVRQNIPAPIVLKEKHGSPWWGWEDGGIYKVWMTGTGFTIYRVSSMKKITAPTKEMPTAKGSWPIKEYFRLEDGTDDYALAKVAEEAGLSWYVHGGVVCQQLELTGHVFDVSNARHRIGGKDERTTGKVENPAADHDSGAAAARSGKRPAADVRTRRRGGSVSGARAAASR